MDPERADTIVLWFLVGGVVAATVVVVSLAWPFHQKATATIAVAAAGTLLVLVPALLALDRKYGRRGRPPSERQPAMWPLFLVVGAVPLLGLTSPTVQLAVITVMDGLLAGVLVVVVKRRRL